MRYAAYLVTATVAAIAIGALAACGPAVTPTPGAKTGGSGGTTPTSGSAVVTRMAGTPSPAAATAGTPGTAVTGTPGAAGTGTPGTAGAGTPRAAMTGTPSTGTTDAATTGTPAAGTAGAGATGTPMAGTTGATTAGTPSAAMATGTPTAGTTGAGAAATGTPMAGTTGITGTTGTPAAATTGMPQVRIMQSISLQNPTPSAIDISSWRLRIGSQTFSLPSNARIGPNGVVTIHFGEGTSRDDDIFLGSQAQQMTTQLRPGARVMLENPQGQSVAEFALPA